MRVLKNIFEENRVRPDLSEFNDINNIRDLLRSENIVEYKEETDHIRENPIYTINNYYKLRTIEGISDFKTYHYQSEYINECQNFDNIISHWSRQMGKSSLNLAVLYHDLLNNNHKKYVVFGVKQANIKDLMYTITVFSECFPKWMRQEISRCGNNLMFRNGCTITFSSYSTYEKVLGGLDHKIHYFYLTRFSYHYIISFYIAVDNPFIVCSFKCLTNLSSVVYNIINW